LSVVVATLLYPALLRGTASNGMALTSRAENRVTRVLAALLIAALILLARRAAIVLLDGFLHAGIREEMRDAALQDAVFGRDDDDVDDGGGGGGGDRGNAAAGDDDGFASGNFADDDVEAGATPRPCAVTPRATSTALSATALPGPVEWLRLAGVAHVMRARGMHAVDPRLPPGPGQRVADQVLRTEAHHLSDELFVQMATTEPYINLVACQDYCDSNALGERLYAMLARFGEVEISRESMRASVYRTLVERLDFQRLLEGKQLLVRVTDDLLGVVVAFVIALVILDAFDIDTSPIMRPGLAVVACAAFIFAPFLRDFAASLYLLFFVRPFGIGDYITVDAGQCPGEELLVKRSRVMVTHFRNEAGEKVYVPNAILAQSKIRNLSQIQRDGDRLIRLRLSRGYIPRGREASNLADMLVLQSAAKKR
jgi:hypothetical protein